jgi:outer membrane lipoprotein-sorting protein
MAYNDVTGNSTSITYEEIELNMPLSDSDFSLSLPSDVMVQDIYGE